MLRGECMAQGLTSPQHRWGYDVPVTRGWSDHDYKCTTETYPPSQKHIIKHIRNLSKFSYRFSAMTQTGKAWCVFQKFRWRHPNRSRNSPSWTFGWMGPVVVSTKTTSSAKTAVVTLLRQVYFWTKQAEVNSGHIWGEKLSNGFSVLVLLQKKMSKYHFFQSIVSGQSHSG